MTAADFAAASVEAREKMPEEQREKELLIQNFIPISTITQE